jgi:DNA-binding MarR family transcriptional regulator
MLRHRRPTHSVRYRTISERTSIVAELERAVHLLAVQLEQTGLSQAEAHVLARLARAGPTTPTELHRSFGHKRSTLTSVLDRLEARGYTRRRINPADRRSFVISLTAPGKRAATAVLRTVTKLEAAIARRTTARDRAGFAATLAALEAELG